MLLACENISKDVCELERLSLACISVFSVCMNVLWTFSYLYSEHDRDQSARDPNVSLAKRFLVFDLPLSSQAGRLKETRINRGNNSSTECQYLLIAMKLTKKGELTEFMRHIKFDVLHKSGQYWKTIAQKSVSAVERWRWVAFSTGVSYRLG